MANCHELFLSFLENLTLPVNKKNNLKSGRKALREIIKNHFNNNLGINPPLFGGQGSFMMDTIIHPISGEYDVDDGVYLQSLDKDDMSKWPAPITVHSWIVDATNDHTDQPPVDKNTCVRIIYAGDYHIDLPIYGEYQGNYYLARKTDGDWYPSDPKLIIDWFNNLVTQKGEQLRRIVKYIKGWADKKSQKMKTPSSILLTVLVAEYFLSDDRDDYSFVATIKNIYNRVLINFNIYNPTDLSEKLSDRCTQTIKDNFLLLLRGLLESADEAMNENNLYKACLIWGKEFGERFPGCEICKESSQLKTSAPAILRNDARSA